MAALITVLAPYAFAIENTQSLQNQQNNLKTLRCSEENPVTLSNRGGTEASSVSRQPVIAVWPLTKNIVQIISRGSTKATPSEWDHIEVGGNKSAIQILGVHQFPVQQPDYDIAYAADVDNSVVSQESRVAVKIPTLLRNGSSYRFYAQDGFSLEWHYHELCAFTPVIQHNQTAYVKESGQKWAYLSWWLGSAGGLQEESLPKFVNVLNSHNREVLAKLPVVIRNRHDPDSYSVVAEVNLSSIESTQTLVLQIPGVGVSDEFAIADQSALAPVYRKLMFALTHNRFGYEIDHEWSQWPRQRDHTKRVAKSAFSDFFAFLPENSSRDELISFSGGHFDAGDFDIRPSHTVVAQLLMSTYEFRPEAFYDGQHQTVEGGNGIPDILDEALWSLRAWEVLQEDSGAVRAGVESYRHPWGIYSPEDDELPYWAYNVDPNTTARVAALFAQMSRLLKPFDAGRSQQLESRALRAYAWAINNKAKPAWVLYAASELYAATGLIEYKNQVELLWPQFGPDGVFSYLALEHLSLSDYADEARIMPDYIMGYLLADKPNPELLAQARKWFQIHADDAVQRLSNQTKMGHRTLRKNTEFGWGQAVVQGRYLDPVFASLRLGGIDEAKQKGYKDAIYMAADFVLGANSLGLSWITGTGHRAPKHPLHLQSLTAIKNGKTAIPGITVFGPASDAPNHPWMKPALDAFNPPLAQHPPMWRYADLRTLPHVNEFTVWETQAPQIQLFGIIMGLGVN